MLRALRVRLITRKWRKLRRKHSTLPETTNSTTAIAETQQVTKTKPKFPVRELERFIPVTRRSLLQMLREDNSLLRSEDKLSLETLVASLDAKYSQRFYSILEETKVLYDPLDPDKDTYRAKELSQKEMLDTEYDLLQKIGSLLEMANFTEIPKDILLENLRERNTSGVIVSVNPLDYELLNVWTKGHEIYKRSFLSYWKDRALAMLSPRHVERRSANLYTRVFLAVRCKGEKRVYLKVFKEVHINELEHLLPKGKIKMSQFDQRFLVASTFMGASVPLLRAIPFLQDVKAAWFWGSTALAAFIAGRTWIGYKNRRNQYLANLATTLYYKTVANNRGVLTLLCDRAQDEEVKEALLAYTFLLNPRKAKDPGFLVYDTPESLKGRVEEWLTKHFKLDNFRFDIDDALLKLDDLGLLVHRRNGTLSVASMKEALSVLPGRGERWMAVVARRDSESSDGQLTESEGQDRESSGWR